MQFNGSIPFRDEAGFEKWFKDYSQALSAPVALTSQRKAAARFQQQLVVWHKTDEISQQQALQNYKNNIAGTKTVNHPSIQFFTILEQLFVPVDQFIEC